MVIFKGVHAFVFKAIKIAILLVIKYAGGFWLAKQLNKGNTCVLCYHGFSYKDESSFRPKLFMKPEHFASRMQWLANSSYKVVSLQEATKHPHKDNCVVLTMDDGWAATYELISETLAKHQFPLMLYITSYYAAKQGAVINVALAYLFWKSIGKTLKIDDDRLDSTIECLIEKHKISQIVDEISCALQSVAFQERQEILCQISEQLGHSLLHNNQLMFRSLNLDEMLALKKLNVDIQLHTHRHCSPQEEQAFKNEIMENIQFLSQVMTKEDLQHFCYPSGEYYLTQLPWLSDCNVRTATTVQSGMLTPQTDLLQIPRFLDGADVHQLEFEAELCGLASYLRKLL